ncbi:molybdopterin-binding protein, partial [Arthrospira platensis SPKY2]
VEETESLDGDRVRINSGVGPGTAIRAAGEDVMPGDRLFEAGTEIRPAVHGVLASVNARRVAARPRARVAILSTGDELVTDGSPLAPGQIRESNISMLVGLAAQAGCIVTDLGVIADDEAVLERVVREAAASHDAIITSGGVSMGDYDVVKAVLGRIAE